MFSFVRRRMYTSALPLIIVLLGVFLLARLTGDPTNLYLPESATPEQRAAVRRARTASTSRCGPSSSTTSRASSTSTSAPRCAPVSRRPRWRCAPSPPRSNSPSPQCFWRSSSPSIIGCWAAYRPNSLADRFSSLLSMTAASIPDFWFAITGVWLFAVLLGVLPTSGVDSGLSWILPIATLMIRPLGVLTQVVRGAMVSALSAPYVRLARSKGASDFRVVTHHALRNAAAPALTVAGDLAVGLINGAVVVEAIFGWPGIGKLMIDAILQRDFAVLQAAVLLTAVSIFVLNIIIDACYALLDARVREPARSEGDTTHEHPTRSGPRQADHGDRRRGRHRSRRKARRSKWFRLLVNDRVAAAAAVVLGLVFLTAIFGPMLVGNLATHIDLDNSNQAPFTLAHGWANVLGTDPLGRSMLARLIVACRTTLSVAVPAVVISAVVGSVIGMWAGYYRGWRETVAMRVADVIMSFPSLLLAVVVLYVFSPSAANIVLVLAITRIPVYLRTARAESAELQSRLFVDAARTFGASARSIIWRHVLPIVLPTLLTVATLDFCYVMLAESSLSFLGIGIQPPDVSWGLMVSQGRTYLHTAWWLSFFPGVAIVITTVSATILAAWARIATDPGQRWRLTVPQKRLSRFTKTTKALS